jgi:topoisomerase-4 subunit B
VDVPARGKKPAIKVYALDAGELDAIIEKCAKDGVPREKCQVSRFKGLGEMNAEQLWETTLNPDASPAAGAVHESGLCTVGAVVTKLMGKGEAAARRELMELHGDAVEVDI